MKRRRWTKEEENYLTEKWGLVQRRTIAKNLNRTECAVMKRAADLGLGTMQKGNGEFYSPHQISKILGWHPTTIYPYVHSNKLKAIRKILAKESVYQVEHDDLMEFLKEYQDRWDSRKVEIFAFGEEPEWMKEKRDRDFYKDNQYKKWTKQEEGRLIGLVNNGMAYKDIAKMMERTTRAIYNRTAKLRRYGRLQPTKILLYWTDEELQMLKDMKSKEMSHGEIAYELGRERMHVTDKLRRMVI